MPTEPPTGELSDNGKTKTFKITAQLVGPATEVPALAFSYFDPGKQVYRTIRSEPIALSVKGGSLVGAGDVVSATPTKRPGPAAGAPTDDAAALVNADLALSSAGAVEDRPLGGTLLWMLVGLLYAIPLALLAARHWQLRTRASREDAAEVRSARAKVEQLLDKVTSGECAEISVTPDAMARYDAARVEAAKGTIFASGCSSWYLGTDGVPMTWPWSYGHFAEVMAKPDFDDFEMVGAKQPA